MSRERSPDLDERRQVGQPEIRDARVAHDLLRLNLVGDVAPEVCAPLEEPGAGEPVRATRDQGQVDGLTVDAEKGNEVVI